MHLPNKPLLYGMIHLPPLPGTPGYDGRNINEYIEYVINEASKLVRAGFDGVIVENYMDYPFPIDKVLPEQLAVLNEVLHVLKSEYGSKIKIGLNILRNAALQSIDLACRHNIDFIRVNAYLEPVWSPEGFLEPSAYRIWRFKSENKCDVEIYADVNVKHSQPILPFVTALENTIQRGRVNGVIISGEATGKETDPLHVYIAKTITKGKVKVIIGSGVNHSNIGLYIGLADAFIIGTSIKYNDVTINPIDEEKARKIVLLRNTIWSRLSRDHW